MISCKKVLTSFAALVFLAVLCANVAFADGEKTGVVTCSVLNVRETPNTSAKVLTKASQGDQLNVISNSNGWYKVSYDGVTGWVCADYVSVKVAASVKGTVTVEALNLRSGSSTSTDVIDTLGSGDTVSIIGRAEDWYKVKTSDGIIGWVSNQYISVNGSKVSRGVEDVVPVIPADKSGSTTSVRQQILSYAKKFLGTRYVFGGTSPKGFDCSGYVQYVFRKFGVDLDRVASEQATQGKKVKKSDLLPGDLVFFHTYGGSGYISHVGIYVGDGQFIHASSGHYRVMVTDLDSSYYARSYITARRILN